MEQNLPKDTGTSPENLEKNLGKNYFEEKQTAYGHALDLLRYEGEMLWVILSACMVVNVLIVGFIAQTIADKDYCYFKGSLPCIAGAFLGIVLSIAWYGTFLRNSQYYHFRMAQAKQLENKNYPLLRKKGYKFSKGQKVFVGKQSFQLTGLSQYMQNKYAGHILIIGFVIIYILIILFCWPHFNSTCAKSLNNLINSSIENTV